VRYHKQVAVRDRGREKNEKNRKSKKNGRYEERGK